MQHFSSRPRKRPVAEINIVPYIDVMLVLLVIFMITAPLLTQGVNVNLPRAAAKAISSEDQIPIVVSIDAKGLYYLNINAHPEQTVQAAELVNRIAAELQLNEQQHKPQRQILVKGDTDVPYGKVVQAMVLLQQAGVPNVGLMTDPQTIT